MTRCGGVQKPRLPIGRIDSAVVQWRDIPVGIDSALRLGSECAAGSRATLLCVHGWSLDHRSFAKQRALSSAGVSLATFDRRGFGRNALSPGLDRELEDLDAILSALQGPVIGFGVSQGARLLLRYAATRPDRLAGLVLQGGLVDGLAVDENELPIAHYARLLRAGQRTTFAQEWLSHPLMSAGVPEEQQQEVASLIAEYHGRDVLAERTDPEVLDVAAATAGLSLPMAVVDAEHETPLRRQHAAFLIEERGAARLAMPGGHLCHFTHARIFNERLLEWLEQSGH